MPTKRLVSILLTSLFLSCNLWAAPVDGSAPITQGQADEILTELKQIRQLLQGMVQQRGAPVPPRRAPIRPQVPPPPPPAPVQRQAPPSAGPAAHPSASALRQAPSASGKPPMSAKISIADRPVLGEPDAPVTMVHFVDYECPYCRRFFHTTYEQLKREYIDPGKLRLVVKDLPLAFHRHARQAAEAAHCAGEQGSYWPMHEKLYAGGAGLNPGALLAYGQQLGLDGAAFRQCLESGRRRAGIEADIAEAQAAGIPGTPAFILGRSADAAVEGAYIRGALPFPVFQGHIERLLQEPEGGN